VTVPSVFVPNPDQSYLLSVQGDSLREDQISEGDLIIVEARQEVSEGEMAIVLVNHHDILIKKYYPEGPYVRLEALNHNVRPMILRQENLEVQGVLVALLRNYSSITAAKPFG
jgi:repressor LexA